MRTEQQDALIERLEDDLFDKQQNVRLHSAAVKSREDLIKTLMKRLAQKEARIVDLTAEVRRSRGGPCA